MRKIHLNILGIKNFESDELVEVLDEVGKIKVGYDRILYEPLETLKRKIRVEQAKRKRRSWVWAEFICSWSGYASNPSAPRRNIGKHYIKVDKKIAENMPSHFCHRFSDNSTNDWSIKIVSVKGKTEGGYIKQIEEFLNQLKK